jgi:protein N-terminal glutamine amidohydrolase
LLPEPGRRWPAPPGTGKDTGMDPSHLDERWRLAQRHQPFFCEENVWHLLQVDDLPRPRAALFLGNRARSVAMWGQRAGQDPVLWDYHVVLLLPEHGFVVDLDDRDAVAWPVRAWLAHAFREQIADDLQPRFRIVDGDEFLRLFSSDRSHMLDGDGRPLRPLPPWPAPFDPTRGSNLLRFVDQDDAIAGVVTDRNGLLGACGA